MHLGPDDPRWDKVIVLLNGRPARGAIAADTEEGWVEIYDIASMAPLDLSEEAATEALEDVSEVPVEVKTKKIYGVVSILSKPEYLTD
jgi:hypothetical protein